MDYFSRFWSYIRPRRKARVHNIVIDFQPDVADGTKAGVLSVENVDYCIDMNGEQHFTNRFDLMTREDNKCLVVRRGQPFKCDIQLNRPYDNTRDGVSFIFYVADVVKPTQGQGTLAAVPMKEKGHFEENSWMCIYEGQTENRLLVRITPAPNCIVAAWKMEVDTTLLKGTRSLSYAHSVPVYILFNPWCPYDNVYLPDPNQREEYVVEEGGIIWRGTEDVLKPTPWNFAQHGKDVLDCCFYVLKHVAKLSGRSRGDPVKVSRAISAAVNSPDDYGVVMGNWSNDFGGGKDPIKWIGSLNILQSYYKNKKPVKYGQCWVFAGVVTTICRAIGIPCRPVTGFNIAHDSEGSLVVEVFYNDKLRLMEEQTTDSIWNFHVWNEVWMSRPDMGSFYDGWQVIDATPQELSDDMFRCGPASVVAVKEGDVLKPYDNGYVFAEVNADLVYWKYNGDIEPLKLIKTETNKIGRNISTKAIGDTKREDLTRRYKYIDNYTKDRDTVEKALRASKSLFARYYLNAEFNLVKFTFVLRSDIIIGQDFDAALQIENVSSYEEYSVEGILKVDIVTYTGRVGESVKQYAIMEHLTPRQIKEVRLPVTFYEYFPRLLSHSAFNISCMAKVPKTDYDYFAQHDFRVRNPDIKITIDGTPVSKKEFNATIKVMNTLPIPLKKAKFYIQGVGMDEQIKIPLENNVPPGEFAEAIVSLTPPWAGRHQISAKFSSREMKDVDGFLVFNVANNEEFNGNTNNGLETNEI